MEMRIISSVPGNWRLTKETGPDGQEATPNVGNGYPFGYFFFPSSFSMLKVTAVWVGAV
jgi:hypothetical protein